MNNIHCIPIGNNEPLHQVHTACPCHPIRDSLNNNLYVHNAFDCRERWERQGIETGPDSLWVTVVERLNDQVSGGGGVASAIKTLGPVAWRIGWHSRGHWVKSKHGHTNHLWLWIGPTRSQDRLTIYNLVIGPIGIAIGWRGRSRW